MGTPIRKTIHANPDTDNNMDAFTDILRFIWIAKYTCPS